MCRQSSVLTSHVSYSPHHIATFSPAPLVLVFPPITNFCPCLELHRTFSAPEPLCPCRSAGLGSCDSPMWRLAHPRLRPPHYSSSHGDLGEARIPINSHKNSSQVRERRLCPCGSSEERTPSFGNAGVCPLGLPPSWPILTNKSPAGSLFRTTAMDCWFVWSGLFTMSHLQNN